MIQDFLIPFIAVGLAELGDKTQIAVFCLSTRTKKTLRLLLGVVLGFAVADGVAVVLGDIINRYIPTGYVKLFAGILFIIFGIIAIRNKDEEDVKCELKSPLLSSFLIILMSEMGDKTQIASGLFAAQYNPVMVFTGVMLSLALLSVMAVYLGRVVLEKIDKKKISLIAGVLFIMIGLFSLKDVIQFLV